ncbi:MAG: tRNA-dihydrouridine synthase, partial [Microbacterium sp.]|uniref:tRNA dihydrouridine synthase n=1 Tax=Microbacterium sp. TaxID=51671 RepID=UPI00262D4B24
LYGVDPVTIGNAAKLLADEDRADHIDLNFGCPVPKVTRKGGGAALPWKTDLFEQIVRAAVAGAGDIPVTVKMRKGIDDDHLTFLDAGRRAQDAGAAAIALHGRTASQFYSGQADWSAIAALKQAVTDIPVLGNGDIWSAEDAVRMMAETGCDGVVVGRGCLGRPWLFGDLARALGDPNAGEPVDATLGFVADAFKRHAELLVEFFEDEGRGCRDIRKHVAWYFKGYPVGGDTRARLATVSTLAEIDELLATLELDAPYPGAAAEGQRGRAGTPKRPALPEGWLDSREMDQDQSTQLAEAELDTSGG